MRPIEGFDSAPAYTGESIQLPPGAYKCEVKQVNVTMNTNNQEMMVLLYDIAEGEHKDFYKKKFEGAKKSNPNDAKWTGVYKQQTQGNSLPFFKGLITSIEKSNPGYNWNWDENTLKGKYFGGIFGREEFMTNDGPKMATKCLQVRSVDGLADAKIPEDKLLPESAKNKPSTPPNPYGAPGSDGFMNIPPGLDEELPFM